MKRAILIATGTVGGLGAVLAVTPPQFTSTQSSPMALPGTAAAPAATSAATPTAAASATASAKGSTKTPKPTKSAATGTTQTPAAQTPAATQAPTATQAPATKSVSGIFTGDVVNVQYGNVQVKITVANGKITDAQAVQAPSGRNDRWTQMAVPILRQQTLQAQSAEITGASGASFTSYGWYTSLVSALAKAGM